MKLRPQKVYSENMKLRELSTGREYEVLGMTIMKRYGEEVLEYNIGHGMVYSTELGRTWEVVR